MDLLERLQAGLPARYTVLREIGRGGMAVVVLAKESHPDREVAIKVFEASVAHQLGRERFLREVEVTARLTHPHIVPVFAASAADDLLFYVMPYVAGETLRQIIERDGQLDLKAAVRIAREVASALQYAHARGVVHRDIKPENILLHEGHALVTDFGIARAIGEAAPGGITQPGLTVGTPFYMSPEQITGHGPVDGRSDQYALACVLYEMLAGEPPFVAKNPRLVLTRHTSDPVPPLRTARSTVPAALEAVIERALAKSAADRFASAADFAAALEVGAAGVPSDPRLRTTGGAAGSSSLPTVPVPAPTPRRRWPLAAASLAAIAAVGLTLMAWPRRAPACVTGAGCWVDSIAVVPVEAAGPGDSALLAAYYEVYERLQALHRLKVISSASVMNLRSARLTTRQWADTLGARLILAVSVRPPSQLLAELMDARDAVLWRHRGVADSVDHFAEAVFSGVVSRVPGLRGEEPADEHHVHSRGDAAFREGRDAMRQRTAGGLRGALAAFRRAIALDSSFAPAWAELGTSYGLSLVYRYRTDVDEYRAAGLGLAAAERAIGLDSAGAGGYLARFYIASRAYGPLPMIERDFQRASGLRPNDPAVPSWHALVLGQAGLGVEAMAEARRAVELDPVHPARRLALAMEALRADELDTALAQIREARAIAPELLLPRAFEARTLLLLGRTAECLALDLGPHAGLRATCLQQAGRRAEARAIVDSLVRLVASGRSPTHDTTYSIALRAEDLAGYYAWIADTARAVAWVERAHRLSPQGVDQRVLESGLFGRVRRAPAFEALLARLRATVWARVEREARAP